MSMPWLVTRPQFGCGLVANALAASADMDLGAELKEAGGHRFAEPGAAARDQDSAVCEKFFAEHDGVSVASVLSLPTKTGRGSPVKRLSDATGKRKANRQFACILVLRCAAKIATQGSRRLLEHFRDVFSDRAF
jgi:hypothetical protein